MSTKETRKKNLKRFPSPSSPEKKVSASEYISFYREVQGKKKRVPSRERRKKKEKIPPPWAKVGEPFYEVPQV